MYSQLMQDRMLLCTAIVTAGLKAIRLNTRHIEHLLSLTSKVPTEDFILLSEIILSNAQIDVQ